MMKGVMKLMVFFLVLGINVSYAQDADDQISDENLRRYALLMEVKDAMVKEISAVTNDMIREQEGMTGQRYLELTKGEGAEAQEFEKKFVEAVKSMQDERKEAAGEVVKILATKMLPDGGRVYNQIKSAIQSDEEVRERYEDILEEIQTAADGDEEEDETDLD